jgi:hypothetical protein
VVEALVVNEGTLSIGRFKNSSLGLVLKKSRIADLIYGIMRTSTSLTINEKNLIPQKFGLISIPINENYMNVSYPHLEIPEAQELHRLMVSSHYLSTPSIQNNNSVWPNPAEKFINIKTQPQSSVQEVKILNTTGQVVWRGQMEALQSEILIVVEEIPTGLYHLTISSPQGSQSETFFKK